MSRDFHIAWVNHTCGLFQNFNYPHILLGMSSDCQGSYAGESSWPELVGERGENAIETIEWENPLVDAAIVLEGTFVILNIDCNRFWVDEDGVVTRVPFIG